MNRRSSDPQLSRDLASAKPTDGSAPPASTREPLRAIVNDNSDETNTTSPAPSVASEAPDDLQFRMLRLERQNRWMKLSIVVILLLSGLVASKALLPSDTIVRQTLMESKELKLLDNDGQPRLFLRMYSRVPVIQLLDANGKPRMSLGLRFDDTPFFDLSDKTGRTRTSIELGPTGEPLIELFDENGESTTRIR
ncbi:MAG: hypothetical protein ACI8PT_001309 [Gammaproteobacteria bacterium]|jgi:hypothetical protein